MDNDQLILKAIQELAQAILYKEYGKDMHNVDLIRLLSDGSFSEFLARTTS